MAACLRQRASMKQTSSFAIALMTSFAIALPIAATSADGPDDLSLAPIGIHSFYVRAIVQFDSASN